MVPADSAVNKLNPEKHFWSQASNKYDSPNNMHREWKKEPFYFLHSFYKFAASANLRVINVFIIIIKC